MPWGDIGSSTPHTSDSESRFGRQFGLSVSQMPVKSGLPSGVRGAGADGLNFPLPVRGTPAVGYFNHWANAEVHEKEIATATSTRMNGFITPFFHDAFCGTIALARADGT